MEDSAPFQVEDLDDLGMARQQLAHDIEWPPLQGLGHDSVVGEGQALDGCELGGVPGQLVLVHKQTHELCHCDRGVGVVHLEHGLLWQQLPVGAMLGHEAA